jgi:aspartyl/asparaginyl beta-hydroxylase (cupin superfamily)
MSATFATEADIQSLMEAFDRAFRAGDVKEADAVLARACAVAPDHPGILNVAGLRALGAGDASRARALFERAVKSDPKSALLWVNVALARRELGDMESERDAIEKALAIEPRYFPALLHKARWLERQGKRKAAAVMYHAFLSCLPPGVQPPPDVQAAIQYAHAFLRESERALEAFLEPRLAPVRARHAGERLERFEACLQELVGKRRHYRPEPTNMLFPGLPAVEFADRSHYPWLDAFDAATDEIRAEARAALAQDAEGFVPYISKPAGAPVDQWRELNNSRRWSTFFLLKDGKPVDEHLARCPKTAALLKDAPLCEIPGHAPTAFFSVLAPRTRIPPHSGVTNARFIVHLPLIVPPGCMYRVGAERRPWVEGKAWVFDDTFEHEAINDSDEPRVVLIFDVWNCFLTPPERDLVAAVTAGMRDYNEGESPFRQGG